MKKLIDYFVRWKAYTQRSLIYYQLFQSFLIIIIFLREYEYPVFVKAAFIIFCLFMVVVVGRYDRKLKILEKEQAYFNSENKEIQTILENQKKILQLLNRIEMRKK